MLQRFDAGAGS